MRARPRLAAFREFLETESGGAAALLGATLAALVWANSPWRDSYHRLWSTPLSVALGDLSLSLDLAHWVNDGLMTLFFLVIGLEVRREFDRGELRERRRAALPLIAGLGGMLIGMGIPRDEADFYEGELAQGRYVVTVHAEGREEAVRQVFRDNHAYDYATREELHHHTV